MRQWTDNADWDLAIVGSGSAAFAAAIRARDLGASVLMIDRSTIGGTCVNVGCVPSKALIWAGEIRHLAATSGIAGLDTYVGPINMSELVAQKDKLVAQLRAEKYDDLLSGYGIDFIHGTAQFTGPDTLSVAGRMITAEKYVVATGASPATPLIPGLADVGYLTSTTALDVADIPGSLAVIGASATGVELGQFFAHAGAHVTFIDALDRIAPFEEPEVSGALTTALVNQGAAVHCGARITRVERERDKKVVIATADGQEDELRVVVDEILIATGRRPNVIELDLDTAGIDLTSGGAIRVDDHLRTTNPHVFAAGDVTGFPQHVYVAAHQGTLTADNAIGGAGRIIDLNALPRIIFTSPQVAAVGMTEQAATEAGLAVKTGVLPLTAVPRALVNHDTTGLVKIVADAETDKILGVHILADGAGDVIQAAVYAVKFGLTTTDVADTWSPYLTMAEGLKLAAQTFTRDVSRLSCCAT